MQTLEEEKCPRCGMAIWHAYSTDPEIEFECEDITCYACQHKETEEEKDKDRPKGSFKVVRAKHVDGPENDLPSREDFFVRLARQKEFEAKLKAQEEAERLSA